MPRSRSPWRRSPVACEDDRFVLVVVGYTDSGLPVARLMTLAQAKGTIVTETTLAEAWSAATVESAKGARYWAQPEE